MYELILDASGRILYATSPVEENTTNPVVDALPSGIISDYLYVNGKYRYDPLPVPPEPTPETSADDILNVLLGVTPDE